MDDADSVTPFIPPIVTKGLSLDLTMFDMGKVADDIDRLDEIHWAIYKSSRHRLTPVG